jgi:glycylpeptide N-tetradecanoyltransferase
MVVYSNKLRVCEINFLCVHKQLRQKRLAPVLIKEVTRRVNLRDTWQATYTAGITIPTPVSSCQYWHRSINPRKLVEVGFSQATKHLTMQGLQRLYKLPDHPTTPGMRRLEVRDVPSACKGLHDYLSKFSLHPELTAEDFRHWLVPRDGVIDAFVVEAPGAGSPSGGGAAEGSGPESRVVGLVSFYHLPSSVINNKKHKDLRAAYLYYYFTIPEQGGPALNTLIEDGLILARNAGVDVFNCLSLLDNTAFLKDLKFAPGDGYLQYYLYNWLAPSIQPEKMGLVLL